ncbi:hypothetical protein PEPS_34160 (plasmid) [Persicobacter psychrovividus]|uniref:Uncharacterized protein n=1 Tax=Persicobacter psychrovividus TaxID=387638 RepID=A0ABM7VJI6_9BACT|nr:hypothetical protein PEPS_34160 [Persicobacter psychrovividus]
MSSNRMINFIKRFNSPTIFSIIDFSYSFSARLQRLYYFLHKTDARHLKTDLRIMSPNDY